MKICFAGPADSIHIVKWCRWFTGHGHEVFVISFTKGKIPGVRVYTIQTSARPQGSDFSKIRYLFSGRAFREIIKKEQPDIINAHYATSYGAAMALSGVKNYILSVWGSDIYDFPKKSPLHQALLKFSLRKASMLFSTSRAMADEAVRYTSKKFEITPFGVDMKLFSPDKRTRPAGGRPFVIGIVKTLDDLYGIDYLIKAVSMIHTQRPELSLSLRISGTGPEAETYRRLAEESGIADFTVFNGHISQAQAAKEWADMDVAVIPSALYESFGVSAVEAQACQTPLIISDVAGLLETTVPGRSSEVVPKKDAAAIARRILELYDDADRRKRMGEYARAHVLEHYELDHCFNKIETVYLERGGGNSRFSIWRSGNSPSGNKCQAGLCHRHYQRIIGQIWYFLFTGGSIQDQNRLSRLPGKAAHCGKRSKRTGIPGTGQSAGHRRYHILAGIYQSGAGSCGVGGYGRGGHSVGAGFRILRGVSGGGAGLRSTSNHIGCAGAEGGGKTGWISTCSAKEKCGVHCKSRYFPVQVSGAAENHGRERQKLCTGTVWAGQMFSECREAV